MRSLSLVGVVLLIGLIACASFGIAVAGEDDMCVPMGVIPLAPPDSVEAKRAVVDFPHALHFGYACSDCHHTWQAEAPIGGCMTSGCHDLDTLPRKEGSKQIDKKLSVRYYKNAYHGQCIGCHKAVKLEIEKKSNLLTAAEATLPVSGPTGCIECHPKE